MVTEHAQVANGGEYCGNRAAGIVCAVGGGTYGPEKATLRSNRQKRWGRALSKGRTVCGIAGRASWGPGVSSVHVNKHIDPAGSINRRNCPRVKVVHLG